MGQPVTDSGSVVATLRKRIIEGHYTAGTRLAEIPVAEALGVSRTPVRLAFRSLQQEGLLQTTGKRGFVVRAFSEQDVQCAVEVRGVLEGLAARRLAERGMPEAVRAALQACIDEGAAVLAKGRLTPNAVGAWTRINNAFHRTIVEATDSHVIADAIARNDHLPFASADSIVIDPEAPEREYQKLRFAQLQHQLVFEALVQRESARVEMLMREHAYIGSRYGKLFGLTSG
jgi:GntR family transcriptional regulator of vanillate catabolism